MKKPNTKKIAEFLDKYKQDTATIEKVVSHFEAHRTKLEDICNKEFTAEQFSELLVVRQAIKDSLAIPQKYGKYGDVLSRDALKEKESLDKVGYINNLLANTVNITYDNLVAKWQEQKVLVQDWKEEYGLPELERLRSDLNSYAFHYRDLISTFHQEADLKKNQDIVSYLKFLNRIKRIEPVFMQLRNRYSLRQELSKEELHVLARDFDNITKKYKNAENVHNLVGRVFNKYPVLGYKERFIEIDSCLSEIESLLVPKPEPISLPPAIPEQVAPVVDTATIDTLAQEAIRKPDTQIPEYNATPLQSQESIYCPIIRNQGNYFDIVNHLLVIGFPPMKYIKLMDIMIGKTESKRWPERLDSLSAQIEKLSPAATITDLDYLYQLEYALREDMNRGNLDSYICQNPKYWKKAHKALSSLHDYILGSEKALALKPGMIDAHLALSGRENIYNKMIAG